MPVFHDFHHCTCLSCTAAFSQRLANVLDTWALISTGPLELKKHLCHVHIATSTLAQLEVLLGDEEREGGAATTTTTQPVFTAAGRDAIVALALKCNVILKAFILIFQYAAERKDDQDKDDHDNANASPGTKRSPASHTANSTAGEDEKEKEGGSNQAGDKKLLLAGTVPDLGSNKTLGFLRLSRIHWGWVKVRITYCVEQLAWVNKNLVLHLQMGKLAQLQNSRPAQRENGSFAMELLGREMTYGFLASLKRKTQRKAKKQAKEQRVQELREQRRLLAQWRASHSSLRSAASSEASAKTAVDEDKPAVVVAATDKAGTTAETKTEAASSPEPEQSTASQDPASAKGSVLDCRGEKPVVEPTEPAKSSKVGRPWRLSLRLWPTRDQVKDKFADLTSNWTERIFGTEDLFVHDRASETLEAWVSAGQEPVRVPFGHRRLQMGLQRCKSSRSKRSQEGGHLSAWPKNATWQRFVGAGVVSQAVLDEVLREANRLQARERVCLTFNEYEVDGVEFMLVFFAIQPEKTPISFVTAAGETVTFPFSIAKDWDNMRQLILETGHTSHDKPDTYFHICNGHYSIADTTTNTVIPPSTWTNTIQPGGRYKLALWPADAHVLHPYWASFQARHPQRAYPAQSSPQTNTYLRGLRSETEVRAERRARLQERCTAAPRYGAPPAAMATQAAPPYLHGPRPGGFAHHPGASMPRPLPMPMPTRVPPHSMGSDPLRPGVQPVARAGGFWARLGLPTVVSSTDEYAMTESEKKELKFVDYIAEQEELDKVTMSELLARCTTMADIGWDKARFYTEYGSGTDSDDDDDSSDGTSSTASIEDD